MQINLEVTIYAHSTTFMKRGVFSVSNKEYKENPDLASAHTAHEWIRLIKKQTGYAADTEIIKVVYNQQNDITDLVKEL